MADLSLSSSDIVLADESKARIGRAGEAISAGDIIERIGMTWIKANDESDSAAMALTDAAENQIFLYIDTYGIVSVGSVLTQKEIYVISPANNGKIAPIGDLTGSDTLFIVGVAINATDLLLLLQPTGA